MGLACSSVDGGRGGRVGLGLACSSVDGGGGGKVGLGLACSSVDGGRGEKVGLGLACSSVNGVGAGVDPKRIGLLVATEKVTFKRNLLIEKLRNSQKN